MWISKKHYDFLKENAEKNIDIELQILTVKENERRAIVRAMEEYSTVLEERDALKLRVIELEHQLKKRGRWVYWGGWCGNHDMRIEDAVCSECGYKHPTVRWEEGDPRGKEGHEAVLNKLKDECPKCGATMQKE